MSLVTERIDLDDILLKIINMDINLINVVNKQVPFSVTYEITRPINNTPYDADDLINDYWSNEMTRFDFTPYNSSNKMIEIKEIILLKSNNAVVGTENFRLSFWNSNVLGAQTFVDGDLQTPDYNDIGGQGDSITLGSIESLFWTTMCKPLIDPEILFKLDGDFLNFTLVEINAVTPFSGARYSVTLKGVIN